MAIERTKLLEDKLNLHIFLIVLLIVLLINIQKA